MILTSAAGLTSKPTRIISLVPSQTELLFDLDLNESVIGITKFCVHPQEWFRNKTRVGGTKNVDIEKIRGLNPDLIIANKEENVQQQIETLALDFPVWLTDVNKLSEALEMITDIGELTRKVADARIMVEKIANAFTSLSGSAVLIPADYLIWKDPYMTAGADTYVHDMMLHSGFTNVFNNLSRYPEVTITQIKESGCKVVLLSSEPYPFKQKHIDELQKELEGIKIMLVDGELFSWYGSRLLQAPPYFKKLRHLLSDS